MSSVKVTRSSSGEVTVVTLDDGKVNAFNQSLIDGVNQALDEAPNDRGAIVIAGRSGVLSAGFDLKVIASGEASSIISLIAAGGRLLGRIFEYPRPVIVACTGHAPRWRHCCCLQQITGSAPRVSL